MSAGSKRRLAKEAGAEVAAQSRQEKLHAAVARSTFSSQNAKKLPVLAHFWTFRCRKMARRCGVKRIRKSKCAKHLHIGPFFEVRMSKNGTRL